MNRQLREIAKQHELDSEEWFNLRLTFGLTCVERVRNLLEDDRVSASIDACTAYLNGEQTVAQYQQLVQDVSGYASSHPGSTSIDGTGHAAVSATFAVAKAIGAEPWSAAEYAAYASVYAYGAYAVGDPTAYESEYGWQVEKLKSMLIEFKQ